MAALDILIITIFTLDFQILRILEQLGLNLGLTSQTWRLQGEPLDNEKKLNGLEWNGIDWFELE